MKRRSAGEGKAYLHSWQGGNGKVYQGAPPWSARRGRGFERRHQGSFPATIRGLAGGLVGSTRVGTAHDQGRGTACSLWPKTTDASITRSAAPGTPLSSCTAA